MKDLSVVILSFNTKRITEKCIQTALASLDNDTSIDAEVIVFDNASTDASQKMLQRISDKRVKTIISKKNLGYSIGNNEAIKESNGKYVLLLNSDIEVLDDAIPKLYRQFKNSSYDFAGGKLLNKDLTPQPSCGPFYTLPIAFFALFLQGDVLGISRRSPNKPTHCDWISGACVMTTKKNYTDLGGFDDSIFMYWDEMDLFYRAKQNKYSVGFFPEPRFIHLEGASSDSRTGPILKVYQGYIYFYKKHFSPLHLTFLIFMLKLKARVSIVIGTVIGNTYLTETYTKAYEITKKT